MQCTDLNVRANIDDVSIKIPVIDALGSNVDMKSMSDIILDVFIGDTLYKSVSLSGMDEAGIHFNVGDSFIELIFPVADQPIGQISVSFVFHFRGWVGRTNREVSQYNSNLFEIINFYE